MRDEVIVREPGDLLRFPTIEAAARYLEPIDVQSGEWTAWDATGRVLDPVVETTRRGRGIFATTVERVALLPTDLRDPDGLTNAIYAWLTSRGIDTPPLTGLDEAFAAWDESG